jgi:hypothetical protein
MLFHHRWRSKKSHTVQETSFWDFCGAAAAAACPEQAQENSLTRFDAALRAYGLGPHYTRREVDLAFRRLAREAHPDLGGNQEDFRTLVAHRELLLSYITRADFTKLG